MKPPPPLPTDSRPWSRYVRSKRRPDWLPWAFGLLLVISVGVLGYVFGRMESGSPIVLERGQPGRAGMFADDGKDAVETWLADNLDTGEWEEIDWWPPRPIPGWRHKVAKMKLRTTSYVDGRVERDFYFVLTDGRATKLTHNALGSMVSTNDVEGTNHILRDYFWANDLAGDGNPDGDAVTFPKGALESAFGDD